MIKVLFFIHDLLGGGAEKVLVNLVNNMDYSKFDITVMTLFDVGVNRQFLNEKVHYKYVYKKMIRGNSHLMKLLTPEQLHKKYIKDIYDIEIAYLEGPCTRIISGCPSKRTKLVSWIHCTMKSKREVSSSFRNYAEAEKCYNSFDKLIAVSAASLQSLQKYININIKTEVCYNTYEVIDIISKSKEKVDEIQLSSNCCCLIGSGKLVKLKGFDRIARIHKKLRDIGLNVCTYIIGEGIEHDNLAELITDLGINDSFKLLGYKTNPYKYVSKADLFVCSSFSEGFSTAATEALIVGTPVVTVEVSGMKEMLGEHNEYGIVTENSEEALYEGIRTMLITPGMLEDYAQRAKQRGKEFSTEKTVRAVEDMLLNL